MLVRLPWCITLTLVAMVAADASNSIAGGYSNRLAVLAARQDMHDEICYAMADGSISPAERGSMLFLANKTLSPQEYQSFKQSIDRLSPPKPVASKEQMAKRWKSGSSARAAYAAKKTKPNQNQNSQATASLPPKQAAEPASGPVMPTGAILPDRMGPMGVLR